MLKKKHFICLFLIVCPFVKNVAQVIPEREPNVFFHAADSGKLSFHLYQANFFKNNEYFNNLHEGETLPGSILDPAFVYQPGSNTRLETGVHLLKFFGQHGFNRIEPILRFQYQPANYFQMVIGTIYGGAFHGLIEPLYQWESTFSQPLENGLQFLFNTKRLHADTWLNWKRFIEQNDPFQEELTVGTTFSYQIVKRDNSFSLSIPFQTTINHHGGQIIADHVPLRTIFNYATGISTEWIPQNGMFKKLNFQCWLLGYNDISHTELQVYREGFAVYPKTTVTLTNFELQTGYFHGEGFMSSEGEPLFFSANIPYNQYLLPTRNMITCKLIFNKKIQRGIHLAAYGEIYKDFNLSNMDYDYGVHLIFDNEFFITHPFL